MHVVLCVEESFAPKTTSTCVCVCVCVYIRTDICIHTLDYIIIHYLFINILKRNSPHTPQTFNVRQTAYLLESSGGQVLNSCFTSITVQILTQKGLLQMWGNVQLLANILRLRLSRSRSQLWKRIARCSSRTARCSSLMVLKAAYTSSLRSLRPHTLKAACISSLRSLRPHTLVA